MPRYYRKAPCPRQLEVPLSFAFPRQGSQLLKLPTDFCQAFLIVQRIRLRRRGQLCSSLTKPHPPLELEENPRLQKQYFEPHVHPLRMLSKCQLPKQALLGFDALLLPFVRKVEPSLWCDYRRELHFPEIEDLLQ